MRRRAKLSLLIALALAAVALLLTLGPLPQDPAYHEFADRRRLFTLAGGWNVFSSVLFSLFGLYGLTQLTTLHARLQAHGLLATARLFFVGLLLTGLGSAYYHQAPNNATLVWDRLAMTLAFMALFNFILTLHLRPSFGARALGPLLALGVASVLLWAYSERAGQGDLRLYVLVQYLPGLLIPMLLLMFPRVPYRSAPIWALLALYVLAKLAENLDAALYELLGLSGHTLKHLLAALSGPLFLRALASLRE